MDNVHIYIALIWILIHFVDTLHACAQGYWNAASLNPNLNHTHQTFWLFLGKKRNEHIQGIFPLLETNYNEVSMPYLIINASRSLFFLMHVQLSCLNFQQLMLCSLYPQSLSRANKQWIRLTSVFKLRLPIYFRKVLSYFL